MMIDDPLSAPITERSGTTPPGNPPPSRAKGAKCRVSVPLDAHRTVTVSGAGRDLDGFIDALEQALGLARKARSLRVSLATFAQMAADQSRAS